MLFNGFDFLIMCQIIKRVMVAIIVIIFLASNPWKQGKEACCYQRKSLFNPLARQNKYKDKDKESEKSGFQLVQYS